MGQPAWPVHVHLPLLLSLVHAATAFEPLLHRRNDGGQWPQPTETPSTAAVIDGDSPSSPARRHGWADPPEPTEAPRYGRIELFNRANLGTNTCGYVSGRSDLPLTCVQPGAYCTNDGVGNMDCCPSGIAYTDCTSTMFSSCLDNSASAGGACAAKGPRTICCPQNLPSCLTLIFSTTASPGRIFSILECQASGGLVTLLDAPVAVATTAPTVTGGGGPTDKGTSAGDGVAPTAAPSPGGSASESVSLSAIVGAAVGGVGVTALVVLAVWFFVFRKRGRQQQRRIGPLAQHPPAVHPRPPQPPPMATPPKVGPYMPPPPEQKLTPVSAVVSVPPYAVHQGRTIQQHHELGGGSPLTGGSVSPQSPQGTGPGYQHAPFHQQQQQGYYNGQYPQELYAHYPHWHSQQQSPRSELAATVWGSPTNPAEMR